VLRRAASAALALVLAACGGRTAPGPAAGPAAGGTALVSLSRVPLRAEPTAKAAIVSLLPRGAEVEVGESQGAFVRVSAKGGSGGWLEAGTFETAAEKEARERRTKAVEGFPPIPARIVAPCPIYLAPDYGAARWGELEEGDPVEVVLADHDFLGVRLLGIALAFVPSHAVRYSVAPTPTPEVPAPAPARAAEPAASGATGVAIPGPVVEPVPAAPSPEPYAALPAGAEAPVLKTRVEPQYPLAARRAGIGGEVVLQVVVERDGTVGGVFPVKEGPLGLTEAATDAVRRWVYEPARLEGKPIAVLKTVRVRFMPAAP
jgi:TonB family protein